MLDGTWILDTAELGGNKLPDEGYRGATLVLQDGTYTFQGDHGEYHVHTGGNAMDIVGTDGPNAGRTFLAIYELRDDVLRICYDLTGTARPLRFATQPGTQQFLAVYRRDAHR